MGRVSGDGRRVRRGGDDAMTPGAVPPDGGRRCADTLDTATSGTSRQWGTSWRAVRVEARLGAAFAILVGLLLAVGWTALGRFDALAVSLEQILGRHDTAVQRAEEALRLSNRNNRITLLIFLLTDRPQIDALLDERRANSARIAALIDDFDRNAGAGVERRLLAELKNLRASYMASYQHALALRLADGRFEEGRTQLIDDTLQKLVDYHNAWQQWLELERRQMANAVAGGRAAHASARRILLLLLGGAWTLAILLAVSGTRHLAREMAERTLLERELTSARDRLESRVRDQTVELLAANNALREDIARRDVSERERALLESRLRQAQKLEAVGQLAAGIAHEINTPIQYVGDNTRFLRESFDDILSLLPKYELLRSSAAAGTLTPQLIEDVVAAEAGVDLAFLCEEIPQAIAQALEGVERVGGIVAAMKAFSHPGKDKVPADINKALQTTITVCRHEWKYVADLTTAFDDSLPHVSCVIGEVNQVFINIIVNAAHAIAAKGGGSGERGLITVETSREGNFAEVRITDTGGGIPAAVRDRVFEPFFTTKDVGKGTGQGLSISHSVIVKKHGGQLFFKSDEGGGTTFFVRLPIDADAVK
jgi:signal transduction histidine kinase